jgi:phospholipase/lecithinase/hemolysin
MQFKFSMVAISVAVALATGCGGGGGADSLVPSNAGGVTRIVAFGDSLSDPGAYAAAAAEKQGGRFTINTGSARVWTEVVAADYGLPLRPNQFLSPTGPTIDPAGTSYAEGGARVTTVFNPADGTPVSGLELNLVAPFVVPTGFGIKQDVECTANGTTRATVGNNVYGNSVAQAISPTALNLAGCIVNHLGPAEAAVNSVFPLQNAGSGFLINDTFAVLELDKFGAGGAPNPSRKKLIEARNGTRTGVTTLPISVQVDRFLASAPTEAQKQNTLIFIQGGANDFFALATAVTEQSFNPLDQTAINGFIGKTASDFATQILRLQGAGFTKIIYSDVPNIGDTPFGRSSTAVPPANLTGLSQAFNATVDQILAANNVDNTKVKKVSAAALFTDILTNNDTNAAYRFTVKNENTACKSSFPSSTSVPGRTTSSSLFCNTGDLNAPGDPDAFVFADGVHPSPKVHRLFAQSALTTLRTAGWR